MRIAQRPDLEESGNARAARRVGLQHVDRPRVQHAPEVAQIPAVLAGGCVDVLQADATRCGGLTGFRAIGALAAAHGVPLSAHCAPSLHLHAACAVERLAHVEYFHDHVRVDHTLLDGVPEPVDGHLRIDASRAGHGMSPRPGALRWEDV